MIGDCFNSKFFNLNVILKFGKNFSIGASKYPATKIYGYLFC